MELAGRLLRGPGRGGASALRAAGAAVCGAGSVGLPRHGARRRVSPGPGAAARGALRCSLDAAACPGRRRAAAPRVFHLSGHRGQVQPGGRRDGGEAGGSGRPSCGEGTGRGVPLGSLRCGGSGAGRSVPAALRVSTRNDQQLRARRKAGGSARRGAGLRPPVLPDSPPWSSGSPWGRPRERVRPCAATDRGRSQPWNTAAVRSRLPKRL